MDIGSVQDVSAIQAAITRQQIGMAVLKKTLDISKVQAQAAIELVESVVEITEQHQSHDNRQLDTTI